MRHALAATLLLAAATSCSPGSGSEPGAGPPRRVVSLAPSCTETLIELGLADRLVGISDYCPQLPDGNHVARIGGLVNPNVEVLLGLEPDCVLTVQNAEDRTLATLRRQGIAVRAKDPQSLAAMLAEVQELGDLFVVAPRASELVADLRARLDRVAAETAARGSRPSVYVEVDYPQCWTVGRKSFVHDAIEAAGGRNVFADLDRAYAQVNKEEVLKRDPDWVLLLHPIDRPIADRVELAQLDAVKAGRVIADLDRDDLLHSSPRLVKGIEALARRLASR